MTTFEIYASAGRTVFVIYILAGVTSGQNKGAEQGNSGADFKICDQNGVAGDGLYQYHQMV